MKESEKEGKRESQMKPFCHGISTKMCSKLQTVIVTASVLSVINVKIAAIIVENQFAVHLWLHPK